jgi:hypothetical protein
LLPSLSLSLSLGLFRVPQDKENEKTMKSTSNEEMGFVCALFRFRVSGKRVLAGVGRVIVFDDNRQIRFLTAQESEIFRFSMTSKNHIKRDFWPSLGFCLSAIDKHLQVSIFMLAMWVLM